MDGGAAEKQALAKLRDIVARVPDKAVLDAIVAALEAGDGQSALHLLEQIDAPKPVARPPRVPGRFKGQFDLDLDFFAPLTDEEIKELMGE